MSYKMITKLLAVFVTYISFGQVNVPPQIDKQKFVINKDNITYTINPIPTSKEIKETLSKVREFIWEHWQNQKEGTVTLKSFSKEGAEGLTVFQIITPKIGKQQVIIRIESKNLKKDSLPGTKKTLEFMAETLDRIELKKSELNKNKEIPQMDSLSSKLYKIQFKDNKGKIVFEI